jgi:hypothetical protein
VLTSDLLVERGSADFQETTSIAPTSTVSPSGALMHAHEFKQWGMRMRSNHAIHRAPAICGNL